MVHGDGVFVVGAPDEFFEEMVVLFVCVDVWFFYGFVGHENVHSAFDAVDFELADVGYARGEACFYSIQVVGYEVAAVAVGAEPDEFVLCVVGVEPVNELLDLFWVGGGLFGFISTF